MLSDDGRYIIAHDMGEQKKTILNYENFMNSEYGSNLDWSDRRDPVRERTQGETPTNYDMR